MDAGSAGIRFEKRLRPGQGGEMRLPEASRRFLSNNIGRICLIFGESGIKMEICRRDRCSRLSAAGIGHRCMAESGKTKSRFSGIGNGKIPANGGSFVSAVLRHIIFKKESKDMTNTREELIQEIEMARERLNSSIDEKKSYGTIYQCSIELDRLLNQYVIAGY